MIFNNPGVTFATTMDTANEHCLFPFNHATALFELHGSLNLISSVKEKNNSNQSLDHPNKGYGKIILAGIAIFSVAILASILVVKTRKRTAKRKK